MMDITEREMALVDAVDTAAGMLEEAALAFRSAFLDARLAERRGRPAPASATLVSLPEAPEKMVPVPLSWLEALAAFILGDQDADQRAEMAAVIRRLTEEFT
jgi:hypothetical protein